MWLKYSPLSVLQILHDCRKHDTRTSYGCMTDALVTSCPLSSPLACFVIIMQRWSSHLASSLSRLPSCHTSAESRPSKILDPKTTSRAPNCINWPCMRLLPIIPAPTLSSSLRRQNYFSCPEPPLPNYSLFHPPLRNGMGTCRM